MVSFLIALSVVFILALLVISFPIAGKDKDREQFLREMADFLEGDIIKENDSLSKISFVYKNHPFVYEDIVKYDLGQKYHKGFIKAKIQSPLVLFLIEKERQDALTAEGLLYVDPQKQKRVEIFDLPEELSRMRVFTSDPFKARKVLNDQNVLKMLIQMKNIDYRGAESVPVKIVENMVSVEVYSKGPRKPNLVMFKNDPSMMDEHLRRMIVIADKVDDVEHTYS